jgi:signal transduction histidine kinase
MIQFRNLNYRLRATGLILLGCLLIGLAGLQYHWLNEISRAQIDETRRQLEAAINRLACQFNVEITQVAMAFHPTPGESRDQKQALTEAWRAWRAQAAHPELLRSVVLLNWSADSNRWVSVTVGSAPGLVAAIEDIPFRPAPLTPAVSGGVRMLVPRVLTVHGNPVLVQPILSAPVPFPGPSDFVEPNVAWLVLTFNGDYLVRQLLPSLAQRNLGSIAQTEYALRIRADGQDQTISADGGVVAGGEWRKADVTTALFGNRFNCISEGGFAVATSTGGIGLAGMVRMSPQLQVPRAAVIGGPGAFGISATSMSAAAPDQSSWNLLVRHQSGSLEQALADFRRRNLLVSGGVLLILATSIAALTLSAERLRVLAKAQTEMAIGLSHELKTPLTALRIAAANLKSGTVTTGEQVSRYGDVIDEQSRRLLALVENTLRYARAQPSVSDPVRFIVEPEEIVQAALKNRAEELVQANVRVSVTAQGLRPICADGALLTHCLENLIDNAVKYAARGEFLGIQVEAVERGRRKVVRFTVEDRGGGIGRQDLPYVFEPFYRGVAARSSRSGGIGVGLAFVKRVVEAHGGRVEARNTADGAAFVLEIPDVTSEGQ